MKKLFIYKALWLLLLLPLFSGCNNSDDTSSIFTGKTWKLNYITLDGQNRMFDFWGGDANKQKKSLDKLNMANTYTLRFEGVADGDMIQGKVIGKLITSDLQGSWNANGKGNDFKATITGAGSTENTDNLATEFMKGLNAATSYKGSDNNNLYLLYKSNNQTFRMVFRVASN